MKKIFMLAVGAAMISGYASAGTYDSSTPSAFEGEIYEDQSMEDVREQEMIEDEARREQLAREEMEEDRYKVDVDELRSSPIGGASAPRYNSDENSSYR